MKNTMSDNKLNIEELEMLTGGVYWKELLKDTFRIRKNMCNRCSLNAGETDEWPNGWDGNGKESNKEALPKHYVFVV